MRVITATPPPEPDVQRRLALARIAAVFRAALSLRKRGEH